MKRQDVELCRRVIAEHSKSFALASRLLPGATADRAAVVYAWCRRADDAVDDLGAGDGAEAIGRLREELEQVYAGTEPSDPTLAAFRAVVREHGIPRAYPEELLLGMEMDVSGTHYPDLDALLAYGYRVAGTVGLMMCHVMGLSDARALRHAAHMGIAMQLTNICRDVLEDWDMGRLYVPSDLLARSGAPDLAGRLGGPIPREAVRPMATAVGALLDEAERYYRSGDLGVHALPLRSALAVRAARRIYAAIGSRVRRMGCDVTRGRVWVSGSAKLGHVAQAAGATAADAARRAITSLRARSTEPLRPEHVIHFPSDVLPPEASR